MLVAATTTLVMLAFVIPLAALVERAADREGVAGAGIRAESVVPPVAGARDEVVGMAARAASGGGYAAVVRLPDGRTVGSPPGLWTGGSPAEDIRTTTLRRLADGSVVIDQPVFRDDGTAVVSVQVSGAVLDRGVLRSWVVLCGIGLALVALSLLVADRLARSLTRPVSDLASAAERLGRGDLSTPVLPEGPPEIREVGSAMNTMAERIAGLVDSEREAVADMSHRLRTPVTALRLNAENLADPDERARLTADVDELVLQVDAVIAQARRPAREVDEVTGAHAVTDLVSVVRERMDFWQVLAEEQSRRVWVDLPSVPCLVSARPDDVRAALDALLDNVFAHTADATGFAVTVSPQPEGGALLTVLDDGEGFTDRAVLERGQSRAGSSGLGLDIAVKLAERSGGWAEIGDGRPGAVVHLRLDGPAPASQGPLAPSGQPHAP
jgi:signal transduction histidine kinase